MCDCNFSLDSISKHIIEASKFSVTIMDEVNLFHLFNTTLQYKKKSYNILIGQPSWISGLLGQVKM